MLKLLDGYKTYITGGGLIAKGAWEISEGKFDEGIRSILEGIGFITLRAGVKKSGPVSNG